ncbi:IGS10 protein, partial [Lophotis ruficrista]|nr:IGS10 protein [Lophotis ruficrista]
EDGRIVVVTTGTFTLRTADTFDTGLYHCVGTNYDDADTLTFRITVVEPYVEHSSVNGAQLSAFVGSTLYLPCTSTAVPDAAVSWVLPEQVILQHSVRNKHIFDNGTLRIQGVTERDRGYFRCVAANQYGVDLLVFQVLVRKEKTTLKKKQVAVGEWEGDDGSGNAMVASATTQKHPLAAPATTTADRESAGSALRNRVAQSAQRRNGHGKTTFRHYRDKMSRRFRAHRRQFVSSARRVDPQHWAAFLEKTKRNSTLTEKQGEAATKPPIQVPPFSKVPGAEEETSGDLVSPEEEFMIPVTGTAPVSALGRAMERVVTARPEVTARSTPARRTSLFSRRTSLLAAETVTPLPPPLSRPASPDSRRPQTDLKPTITNSRERADFSQTPASRIKQRTVPGGASRTSALLPAGQGLVYSGESSNQHVTSVPPTPVTDLADTSQSVTSQNAVDKPRVFTESVGKIPTNPDHRVPVATVSEPSPDFGHVYFHNTQEPVTPKPPLDSATIAHQQIQIMQDVTTHTAQAQQQHGRRRKISGRRRIVRPGRIPGMKEHRYRAQTGSVGGNTAVAADVQLKMKYVSNLPALNNLSSSITPLSPEAPPSPSPTRNMPLERPAGAHQNAAFLREGEEDSHARRKAATTVVPFVTKATQDTPQRKLESSAPFQTNTESVQPFSTGLPTTAIHTAHTATEGTHAASTKISSTLGSVSPSIEPTTSPENSQRGGITWEHLFGNAAQEEVLQKLPKQMFPSPEVPTVLPKPTAALSISRMSRLHVMPLSAGGNHSSGFVASHKPIHDGSGRSEHLPTAKPPSSSSPAAGATKEMDVTGLKPTVAPIIAPQTDTKIPRSKVFRVGGKRGQRRKRPPKTPASQSVAAGISAVNTAGPGVTTGDALTAAASLPAEPRSGSASTGSVTALPAPRLLGAPEAPRHVPAAATQASGSLVMPGNSRSATLPPDSCAAPSPPTPTQTTPQLSKPSAATGTQPGTACATSGSEPAQHGRASAGAGETSPPKTEESVIQEEHVAQSAFPARTEPSAPAAATASAPASTQHASPLP